MIQIGPKIITIENFNWAAFAYARALNLIDIIIIVMKLHGFHSDAVSRVVL